MFKAHSIGVPHPISTACPSRTVGGQSAAVDSTRTSGLTPLSGRRTSCKFVSNLLRFFPLISWSLCRGIYVDTRLHTLLDMRFNKPFFQRGQFPAVVYNGSSLVALPNPWINGTNATLSLIKVRSVPLFPSRTYGN
jgi:hypothetical protein